MTAALIALIITIIVVGIVLYVVMLLLDMLPMDAAFKQIAKVLIILVAVLFISLAIYAALNTGKAKAMKIDDNPAPEFRKAAKRYNHDLTEARFGNTERRLDGHDAELEQLWNTMRSEDAAIRRENGAKFDAILLSLGEIKGEIKKL